MYNTQQGLNPQVKHCSANTIDPINCSFLLPLLRPSTPVILTDARSLALSLSKMPQSLLVPAFSLLDILFLCQSMPTSQSCIPNLLICLLHQTSTIHFLSIQSSAEALQNTVTNRLPYTPSPLSTTTNSQLQWQSSGQPAVTLAL